MADKETETYYQAIRDNLRHVHKRISSACRSANRNESSVRLLLATKSVLPDAIRIAIAEGEILTGENRMQEFALKYDELADLQYERHFIGHLQTNKIKDALKYVTCVQSVDRVDLVQKLDKHLQNAGRSMDIMVQVNTSFEKSKYGLNPDDTVPFLKEVLKYDTLNVKGFMTIGLPDAEQEKAAPSYARLRDIRDRAVSEGLISPECGELSMGMSGDLEVAIREGSTIVRVGTAVFGNRFYLDDAYRQRIEAIIAAENRLNGELGI